MADTTQEIMGIPVNEDGSIVVHPGGGSSTVVGVLPANFFPVNTVSGGLVLKLPEMAVQGDMLTSVWDADEDGKIDIAQLHGTEPTLTKGNLTGTTNQVTLVGGNGVDAIIGSDIQLTLPQDIATDSSPTFNAVKFDSTPSSVPSEYGALFYDEQYKTLATNTGIPGAVLKLGQETHILCINNTGSQLFGGTVVYISGISGDHPTIAKAVNTDYTQSNRVIGMLTTNPQNGEHCMVTISGIVNNVNTSSYAPGTVLYLDSTAGNFTSTIPTPEKTKVRLGYVVQQDSTLGTILVEKQIELNSAGSALDAQSRIASAPVPTSPTVFIWGTEVVDSLGMYDPVTGEIVIPFTGNYTFLFLYNAITNGSAKQLYSAAQIWNGSAWISSEYSTRQLYIAQGVKNVATFVSANVFAAGTRLRFVTWASASGVTLETENILTGYTIPAARLMVTGTKTV